MGEFLINFPYLFRSPSFKTTERDCAFVSGRKHRPDFHFEQAQHATTKGFTRPRHTTHSTIMSKGLSLHIGLNYVDPDHYDGWDGELAACEFDAKDMQELAKARGFKTSILLREKATAKAVTHAIITAAAKLVSGDIFLVSYSGHGGQVPDLNGDEGKYGDTNDRKDETWCLFDREHVDDERAALWAKFKKGVRIVVLSDSCHSGSTVRNRPTARRGRMRKMPGHRAAAVYEKHKAIYDAIQLGLKGTELEDIKATVLLISGCRDEQLSLDGDRNGLFTENLKAVWRGGAFSGGYRAFRDAIADQMPEDQIPVYFPTGVSNPGFEKEQPFTINSRSSAAKKAAKGAKRARPARGRPLDIVMDLLGAMRHPDPQADSNIRTWFKECEKIDRALALPMTRTDVFLSGFSAAFHGLSPGKDELLAGTYKSPRQLAELAG
jgi:metacaspase-1